MPTLPITIYKHWIGYVFISAVGLSLVGAIILAIYTLHQEHTLNEELYYILGGFAIVVLLGTLVALYVYSLSNILITEQGITVTNWGNILTSQEAELAWIRVQDVTVSKDGVLPQILGYGTLLIQTAGTDKNFLFTYTPNPDYWETYLSDRAAATPQLTHNV
jgi:uncharacterized membrane protein YdbT with pleckstrin-like domain